MKHKNPIFQILFVPVLLFTITGCKKFLEVGMPNNQLNSTVVFKDSSTAYLTLAGLYANMIQTNGGFQSMTVRYGGLLADEFILNGTNPPELDFNTNSLRSDNTYINQYWADMYKYIYQANAIIAGAEQATALTAAAKQGLIGEAKFARAFCYFYLVNLFGGVPIITTTDYQENKSIGRATAEQVYALVVKDLLDAQVLVPVNYSTADRVRPNKWAITALLARVQLYLGKWADAEAAASAVIGSGLYTPLPAPAACFLKGSKETIWNFYPVSGAYNVYDANWFIPGTTTSVPMYINTDSLRSAFSAGDLRRANWMGANTVAGKAYYYPYKYKVRTGSSTVAPTEYCIVFRVAEQYLIRAEARAQQNNVAGAASDLNVIRSRAGLPAIADNMAQAAVLDSTMKERQRELFAEWGHRWFDLKRTGKADQVLGSLKGANWQSSDVYWPVPLPQMLANPNLSPNEGNY